MWTWARARVRASLLAIIFAALAHNVSLAQSPPSPPNPPNIQSTLGNLIEQNNICAAVVATISNKQITGFESATRCRPQNFRPLNINQNSVFQAASLSKPIFAYLVIKLSQEGAIDLDRPLIQYLPNGYRHSQNPFTLNSIERWDMVTAPNINLVNARMVLNHTTGLPNWSRGALKFSFTPGEKWQYSGEGYVLLQRVIEQITQKNLQQLVNERIFIPFEMTHSSFVWNDIVAQNYVIGTNRRGGEIASFDFARPIAAATLYTSAEDYAKFVIALMGDTSSQAQIIENPIGLNLDLGIEWGLGWGIENTTGGKYLWHWGNNNGFRNFVMINPATKSGFVMLTNSDNGLKIIEAIANEKLPDVHKVFRFDKLQD